MDLSTASTARWPSFLVDLIPQGNMRRRLAASNGWREDDLRLDYNLLMRGAGSPIGNLRIEEWWERESEQNRHGDFPGVSKAQILNLDPIFLDVWERAGSIAAGSEGVQGDWPKISMAQDTSGLWFKDSVVADDVACAHVIVKRSKGTKDTDNILASEPALGMARAFGLRVAAPITMGRNVIVIPRFDRKVIDGKTVRLGQESIVSGLGVSQWGHAATHEAYIAVLREVTSDPESEIVEYVLRDVLNMAAGNPDSHGRNTALQKHLDGRISLTPLFDSAPMRRATDGGRVTKWNRRTTLDQQPDWVAVPETICAISSVGPDRLLEALREAEPFIRELPRHARAAGVPEEMIEDNIVHHEMVADTLTAIPPRKGSL